MHGLEVHRAGSGEPLVLVHGVASHWQAFARVVPRLAEQHEVWGVDLPGFGLSPPDGTVPSIVAQAERLQRFFADAGLDRPHVVGNSMGGAIALELARRGAVRTATAVSPVGFWTPGERELCIRSIGATLVLSRALDPVAHRLFTTAAARTALSQVFARPWRLTPEEATATFRAAARSASAPEALKRFRSYDFAGGDDLRGTPVTIAWGTRDRLLLHRQAARAAERLPWARHVDLPGLGHVPFADDPGMVASVLLKAARTPPVAPI